MFARVCFGACFGHASPDALRKPRCFGACFGSGASNVLRNRAGPGRQRIVQTALFWPHVPVLDPGPRLQICQRSRSHSEYQPHVQSTNFTPRLLQLFGTSTRLCIKVIASFSVVLGPRLQIYCANRAVLVPGLGVVRLKVLIDFSTFVLQRY